MKQRGFAVLMALLLAAGPAHSDTTNAAPDFNEVYQLIRTHLAGVTEAELNQAAVEGLLATLRGKVTLVGQEKASSTNASALADASLLESNVAYLRLAGLDPTLAAQMSAQVARWSGSNSVAGLVLDLRFVDSDDYASAAAVADLFQTKARPLMDWGGEVARSQEKTNAFQLPVAVLVNRETAAAAEALAALLRDTGVGLILGNPTAGRAMIARDFPLKDGRRLRVATLPVKIGEGVELSARGVQPDISVAVSMAEERQYLNDPYGMKLAAASTNSISLAAANGSGLTNRTVRRPRPNEADLVRARRDGLDLDAEFLESRVVAPAKPLIRDPALARAVDLIKGLAVVRAARS